MIDPPANKGMETATQFLKKKAITANLAARVPPDTHACYTTEIMHQILTTRGALIVLRASMNLAVV